MPNPRTNAASAHPIDPAVRKNILATLTRVERDHDVSILYACESGSRGWGFASPDSDYEVRFLYVHRLDWYLRVHPGRDVIELPISTVYDVNGWELRKALGLLHKGNATLIEWLDSPVVYRRDPIFLRAMRRAARLTHQPVRSLHHYMHMSRKNYREHLRGDRVRLKKYLYVLRPLLAALWIEQGRGVAPMRFQDLVAATITDRALRTAIDQLIAVKRRALESEYGDPIPEINAYVDRELTRLEHSVIPTRDDIDYTVLNRLLRSTILRANPTDRG
jgi:uncharacterized protein